MGSSKGRIAWLVASTLVLLAVLGSRTEYLDLLRVKSENETFQDTGMVALPSNDVIRAMSLGFEPMVSDLLFMQANNFSTSRFGRAKRHDWLDRYFAAIVGYCRGPEGEQLLLTPDECEDWVDGLFPFNPRLYLWASQSIKFAAGAYRPIIDRVLYMEKVGIHYCPDSWEIWYDLGANYYIEHDGLNDKEIAQRKIDAVKYFVTAASLPNSRVGHSVISYITGARLSKSDAVNQIYKSYYSSGEEERFQMRAQLRWQQRDDLSQRYEDEDEVWLADKPYLPQSFYHVLGIKRAPRLNLSQEESR